MAEDGLRGKRAAVLGAGRQGTAAAYDFAHVGGAAEVALVDRSGEALDKALAHLRRLAPQTRFTAIAADAESERPLAAALLGATAALSALPYRFGPNAARAAVAARCHLVDLGGNTDVSAAFLALDGEARAAGIALVPDTGLAPGLANTLAAAGIEALDEPEAARIWCGGLPRRPLPPLGYRLVFSAAGLLNEYAGDAVFLRDGELALVPALSEVEQLDLPELGRVEAFPTSGGTSTAPRTYLGRLKTFEYRTVRYPGHRDRFLALAEIGLLSEAPLALPGGTTVRPRDVAIALLAPLLDHPEEPDLVVLRVEVAGRHDGRPARVVFDLFDREDPATGFTAMERCTAFPAAAVAEMAAAGEIAPGSRPLEIAVPPAPFLARLAQRPLAIVRR